MPKRTIVVNLLAGPGCGKSTFASSIFSALKWKKVDCELASEFAKDLVWEKRTKTFENQIYIFGKQHHRIFRLLGQVDVVITDSPIILTPIYDAEKRPSLLKLVLNEYKKCDNLNVLISRKKDYNPNGRIHGEMEARMLDHKIEQFLKDHKIPYLIALGTKAGVKAIVNDILEMLEDRNETQ